MCFQFFHRYEKIHECSCDVCGRNFETIEKLKKHIKIHRKEDKDFLLLDGFGIVRCNKCFVSFISAEALENHGC